MSITFDRKYRPMTFDEIVGQGVNVRILTNSILSGKIPSAILVSGTRGSGKTTSLRVFAKSLNCYNRKDDEYNPCGKCRSCEEVTNSRGIDVYEIDGASWGRIDLIRKLQEELNFSPIHSKYKIVIIDEVHAVSDSAFQSLLKIIEEPPPCVVFLFATTMLHKVPDTIISRCLWLNFSRVTESDVIVALNRIIKEEHIEIEDKALRFLAREAKGSIRDSVKLLEQASMLGNITYTGILELLGRTDVSNYLGIIDLISKGKMTETVNLVRDVLQKSGSIWNLLIGIEDFYRNMLLLKMGETVVTDYGSEDIPRLLRLYSKEFTLQGLKCGFELICRTTNRAVEDMIFVEMLFLQLCILRNEEDPQVKVPTVLPPFSSQLDELFDARTVEIPL